MINQLFVDYDTVLNKKLRAGLLSQKTYIEYVYVADRLQIHLNKLNGDGGSLIESIKEWQNSGRNKASTETVKRQIIIVSMDITF